MKESINVYLADDHQIVIDGLKLLLKNEPHLIICGSAINGEQAARDIEKLKPELALLDLRMPDKDGLQVIRSLKNKVPTKFIILSMHADKRFINDAMNYGADGYLLKNTGKEELLACIAKVLSGGKAFPEVLSKGDESGKTFLSPRELDVLKLVINEYTTPGIAEKLNLSIFTVETHRKNIIRKTGVKNVAGLVKYAIDNNISFGE